MVKKEDKNQLRQKRHLRMRKKIEGTASRPRLNVFRSNAEIYVQVIDDEAGATLCAANSRQKVVAKLLKGKK
jgi:large subunit ribosomal protein L18